MKKIITILLSGILIVSFSSAYAATTTKTASSTPKTSTKGTVLATVNIYNPKTTKINEAEYSISFDIYNRVGIQSNIRYGIELINADKFAVVDTYLVNESITLKEKEVRNLSVDYKLPGFVPNGNYKLAIVAENQNGLPLAYMPADLSKDSVIKVSNGSQNISINKCILTIQNDASSTASYRNDQGVDIMPTEKLVATCEVSNKGGAGDGLKVELITHNRDGFGNILDNKVLPDSVSVGNNSTQNISFIIPAQANAQLYYVDTFLVNANGEKVSPSYPIYYSIHGSSATIQNVNMDKASYKKGDVANLDVFWTVGGNGIRLKSDKDTYAIKAEIKDAFKNVCGGAAKNTNNASLAMNKTSFNIAIANNCLPAIATVSIYDSKGNLLDSTDINGGAHSDGANINANIPSIKNISMMFSGAFKYYIVVFIIVLALIGYGILKLKKDKENNINN